MEQVHRGETARGEKHNLNEDYYFKVLKLCKIS